MLKHLRLDARPSKPSCPIYQITSDIVKWSLAGGFQRNSQPTDNTSLWLLCECLMDILSGSITKVSSGANLCGHSSSCRSGDTPSPEGPLDWGYTSVQEYSQVHPSMTISPYTRQDGAACCAVALQTIEGQCCRHLTVCSSSVELIIVQQVTSFMSPCLVPLRPGGNHYAQHSLNTTPLDLKWIHQPLFSNGSSSWNTASYLN